MDKETGGSAFPSGDHPESRLYADAGMTLRDYFASSAVNGLMGRVWDADKFSGDEIVKQWAVSAYAVADAMIAARSQP